MFAVGEKLKRMETYKNISILHEDNHILVVVKPQNMPTQKDITGDMDMLSTLKEYIKEKYNKEGEAYLGLVHRLDRPTGGVMVFAKTSKAAMRLQKSMKSGDFEKKYMTVVYGNPKYKTDMLEHYLAKNTKRNMVQITPMSMEGSKRALLDYKVLQEIKDASLILIKLHTGRAHQCRVQMAQGLKCPIIGDMKYGTSTKKCNLALWAVELKFTHPTLKEKMTFRVYPPEDRFPWNAFDIDRFLKININNN